MLSGRHWFWQRAYPVLHRKHVPLSQIWFSLQVLPHAPQFARSRWSEWQTPSAGQYLPQHLQKPASQTSSPKQIPHPPPVHATPDRFVDGEVGAGVVFVLGAVEVGCGSTEVEGAGGARTSADRRTSTLGSGARSAVGSAVGLGSGFASAEAGGGAAGRSAMPTPNAMPATPSIAPSTPTHGTRLAGRGGSVAEATPVRAT